MNSYHSENEGEDGQTPDPLGHLTNWSETARHHPSAVVRWMSQSTLFEPFCIVLGPVAHWLAQPTNSALTALALFGAPMILLILLPLFLILVPALMFFALLAVLATSLQTDADSDTHESMLHRMAH